MAKKPDGPAKPFWTTRDIAEHFGVCERTVRRWIDAGDLVAHRFGRSVRIADNDRRAFLAAHRDL